MSSLSSAIVDDLQHDRAVRRLFLRKRQVHIPPGRILLVRHRGYLRRRTDHHVDAKGLTREEVYSFSAGVRNPVEVLLVVMLVITCSLQREGRTKDWILRSVM